MTQIEAAIENIEQDEPCAYQYRLYPDWIKEEQRDYEWKPCSKESYQDYIKAPVVNNWIYETRALYAIPQPAPPETEWLPIETAPKDRAVLVHPAIWNDKTASIAKWESDRYSKNPRPYWRRDDDMGKVTISRENPPSHWLPLPAAPFKDKP